MDKDRVEGAAHQVKGAVKEVVGKVTGDAKTEAEGAAEKAAGKVQNAVGGAKDAVREFSQEVIGIGNHEDDHLRPPYSQYAPVRRPSPSSRLQPPPGLRRSSPGCRPGPP